MNHGTRPLCLLSLCGVLLAAGACTAGKEPTRIVINVTQSSPGPALVNGYRKTLHGQVLAYHSAHPDADSALLVRANREAPSIAWETDPLPSAVQGDDYRIVWLAGLEREGWPGKEVHNFDLYVNGDRWFTFKNLKDAGAMKWTVTGKRGSELSFEATTADRAGDLFGYMFLRIPKREVTPGVPLVLQVTGEDAGSLDWYMTLQYAFRFTPGLSCEPALTREGEDLKQILRLSLDNLQPGRSVEISATGMPTIRQPLAIGANILHLPIPAVELKQEIPAVLNINGSLAGRITVWAQPVNRRRIYLLSYSHNDIGYTDVQPVIERKQWENLDAALDLIRKTKEYPWDARFRWNLEVMWPLESYLARASEPRRREVVQAVRDGSIGVNALYANVLTGLANAPEMSHFTEYAGRFADQYGIPVTTALVSDIPGFSWGIVPALAQSGVRYFASAPNPGDRIGQVLQRWGDAPFYWASQSGEEKVLMWVAGASYASFHEGDLTRLGNEKIMKLMRKLDAGGYPYEILQLPYTIGGDNGPPDPALPEFVRKWNERYESPRLVIGTHAQMFGEFEKRYGASLPIVKGDFTPYWEDGAASTAAETALNRQAADRLIQGEALWALRAPAAYPADAYYAAWRNVVLWDEHTWGAHNSVTEPDLPGVREQWRIKRQFVLDADLQSRSLLARLLPDPVPKSKGGAALDVYNTNSWPRTDLVLLPAQESGEGDLVIDERGNPLPSQRLSSGELAVLLEDVPPLSARRIVVRAGKAFRRGTARASGAMLENAIVSLSLDPKTGAVQGFTWKPRNLELADRTTDPGLNQYLYVEGKDPKNARPAAVVRVKVKENGPLVASLLVEASAPGCRKYEVEYRIVDGLARVDLIHRLDKQKVRGKEGIHIAFPFAVPGGQLRYDVADGIVRPESDQLPGSCKNFFSVQSWVDVSNADFGVTWTTADAPLIEIGAITAEQPWAETLPPATLFYSYLMNNYWHTNYKADQEGPATFRYTITPHDGFQPEEAVRRGRDAREGLIPLPAAAEGPPSPPLFRMQPAALVVASLKPVDGGKAWLIGVYNPTAEARKAVLEWNPEVTVALRHSNSSGHAGPKVNGDLKVAAWGSAWIRAERLPR